MKSKKNCFNCKITQMNNVIHDKDYTTLKEIADYIGLSYNQIADISSQRIKSNKYNKFKYFPKIAINRINRKNDNDDDDEIYNDKLHPE